MKKSIHGYIQGVKVEDGTTQCAVNYDYYKRYLHTSGLKFVCRFLRLIGALNQNKVDDMEDKKNNTGDCNTGNCNTGNYNTGDYNTGYCNTITPKVKIFNKDSDISFGTDLYYKIYNIFDKYSKPLCEWISASNMTDEEKENNKTWETTQGYLKVNEEKNNWLKVAPEDEEFIRGLPNFDEQILLECTGIDLTKKKVKIRVDGKDILISKEEFESIKKQFMQ